MTVADRIDLISIRRWAAPVILVGDKVYVGRHRHRDRVRMTVWRMLYLPRHAR